MKETIRSLSIYFVIVGIWGLISNLAGLAQSQGNLLVVVLVLPGVGFACAYLYFGIRLKYLLATSPQLIIRVLQASAIYLGIILLISLIRNPQGSASTIVGLLLTWYLVRNVKRLSLEQAGQASAA